MSKRLSEQMREWAERPYDHVDIGLPCFWEHVREIYSGQARIYWEELSDEKNNPPREVNK